MDLGRYATVRTIPPGDIVQKENIGSGSFGQVWKGKWTRINKNGRRYILQVAIKIIQDAERRNVYRERDRMAGLNHPNVVKLLGIVEFESHQDIPWLVLEFLEYGDLYSTIHRKREQGSRGPCRDCFLKFTLGIARGMKYLHSKGIVHGDLAARNCLLGRNNSIKVGDLGYFDSRNSGYYSDYGTPGFPCPIRWMAPENLPFEFNIILGGMVGPFQPKRSFAGDVWAYGVVMYEILSVGKLPFESIPSQYEVVEAILYGKKPTDFGEIEPQTCDHVPKWMHKCWQMSPSDRPTFSDIVDEFEANGGHLCYD